MKAFYCVGTHWDREWYEPFQEFRMWLVELIDEVMDLMERDPEYRCFHLDGQTIVIEDYLEIRPEKRDRLVEFIRQGRLIVGPWYNLPDEWLISGESYVRNLLRGHRICRELDLPMMNFAYTPDQFGHIAALPMIMKGFNLQMGIVWRGTQDETHPAQFIWVGPDGSRLPYHKLCDKGSYAPFLFAVRQKVKEAGYSDESIQELFPPYFEFEKARGTAPVVLMLDAIDHQRSDAEMPGIFRRLQEYYPDIEFEWGSLADFAAEVLQYQDQFPERHGELREPCRDAHRVGQYLIVHTLSSRYPLKQRNGQCQALLEKWVEPYSVFALLAGEAPLLSYLEQAWKYLLRNHPHDSICGCSIDQVHRDMHYRFDQSEMLGDGLLRRILARLGNASAAEADWNKIVIHNPLPYRRKEVVEFAIAFPKGWGEQTGFQYVDALWHGERYNKFHLIDYQGNRIAYQLRRIVRGLEVHRLDECGRRAMQIGDYYHVAAELDLPPCGSLSLRVEGTCDGTRNFGTLRTAPVRAENEHFAFELAADGTGTLTQKASGLIFNGLFQYENAGDGGDGWCRGPLVDDIRYLSPGASVMTAIEEDGPLRTVFRVERRFSLPREMNRHAWSRSGDREDLLVTDHIMVEKHAKALKVRTEVANSVRDHRLRVLFPTSRKATSSFADTPFAIVERPIHIPAGTALWQERVNEEKAFTSWCGVGDNDGGLALLSPWGLHEYSVLDDDERTLAVTLFRSFFKTVFQAAETEGEIQETLTFEYQLLPFSGNFDPIEAGRLVAAAQARVWAHGTHSLVPEVSRLSIEGQVLLTAFKPAEDGEGAILRLWNPASAPATAQLRFAKPPQEIRASNLREDRGDLIQASKDAMIPVVVPAGGLYTIRCRW